MKSGALVRVIVQTPKKCCLSEGLWIVILVKLPLPQLPALPPYGAKKRGHELRGQGCLSCFLSGTSLPRLFGLFSYLPVCD